MWATGGLCVSDVAPSDVSFSPLDDTGGFPPPQPLTPQGIYCVGTRPVPADHGDSTLIQTRIATLAGGRDGQQDLHPARRTLAGHLPDRPRSGDSGARSLHGRHPEDRGSASSATWATAGFRFTSCRRSTCRTRRTRARRRNDRTINAAEMAQAIKQADHDPARVPPAGPPDVLQQPGRAAAERVAEFVRGPVQRVLRSRRPATSCGCFRGCSARSRRRS